MGQRNIQVTNAAGDTLTCLVCHGDRFDQERGHLHTAGGYPHDNGVILICTQCRYTMFFWEGQGIWDLDRIAT